MRQMQPIYCEKEKKTKPNQTKKKKTKKKTRDNACKYAWEFKADIKYNLLVNAKLQKCQEPLTQHFLGPLYSDLQFCVQAL